MLLPLSQNFTEPVPITVLFLAYGVTFYFLALASNLPVD